MSEARQAADPAVSHAKFDREVAQYRSMEAVHRKRGCLLLDATFPEVFVAFAATKIKPALLVAAVVIDFTDYDLKPPSVRFVDPFTREPLKAKDLRFSMLRRAPPPGMDPNLFATLKGQMPLMPTNMIVSHGLEEEPFICLPGIREYHQNPAHTGDSWLLHRASGEGSLAFIVEKIWTYGVNTIEQVQFQVQVQMADLMAQPSLMAIPE